jgi:translation initiation factor IF-2
MGLNEVPVPGTLFKVVKNEKTARGLAEELADSETLASRQPTGLTLEELYARFQAGEAKALNLVIKSDVQGSIDPITSSLEKINVEEDGEQLKINILMADVGNISESDVMLASTSDAVILGFNVEVDTAARRRADSESVEIRTYQIIYKLLEEVEQALVGMLEPVYEDVAIGVAEVRQVFKVGKLGQIAGCYIRDGEARRRAEARVIRNKQILHQGSVASLKRFQEDVREVRTGFECGVGVAGFSDFKEGDLIQFVVRERVR